jgi:hypothetical protein
MKVYLYNGAGWWKFSPPPPEILSGAGGLARTPGPAVITFG